MQFCLILETRQDIQQRIMDELADAGLDQIHISFYLTSIYDYSIYESLSKVIQKLIRQLPTLENLLNMLCSVEFFCDSLAIFSFQHTTHPLNIVQNSGFEKAFLFDIMSKIYIATDSSPVDMQTYEICADMIDVMLDVCTLYSSSGLYSMESSSTIKLNNGMVLYLRGVNRNLALVGLLREENYKNQGIVDYNYFQFRESINEVLEISRKQFATPAE